MQLLISFLLSFYFSPFLSINLKSISDFNVILTYFVEQCQTKRTSFFLEIYLLKKGAKAPFIV